MTEPGYAVHPLTHELALDLRRISWLTTIPDRDRARSLRVEALSDALAWPSLADPVVPYADVRDQVPHVFPAPRTSPR